MDKNRKCPICGGEFEQGTLKRKGMFGLPSQFWTTKLKVWALSDPDARNTMTFRCKNCGYLESYAK